MKNAWFKYDDQPFLFKDLDFGIDMETKVAILGPNGGYLVYEGSKGVHINIIFQRCREIDSAETSQRRDQADQG